MAEQMDRRTFLKRAGIGGAAVAAGSAVFRVGTCWWDQEPGTSYDVLSEHEGTIAETIAEALFPGDDAGARRLPDGIEAGAVDFFDAWLAGLDETTANFIRVVLHAIDDMAVAADLSGRRFHTRPLDERIAILEAWDSSALATRRGAFRSVKLFLSMGYCESHVVREAIDMQFACGGAT
jgi:hypothetical protein